VSGGIAQLFLNLGTRRGCVVSITPRSLYPRKRTGTHCTGGWVGPGAGLDRCGKSRPAGIRSPDLPARSESLYRLRYRGSVLYTYCFRYFRISRDMILYNKIFIYALNLEWKTKFSMLFTFYETFYVSVVICGTSA